MFLWRGAFEAALWGGRSAEDFTSFLRGEHLVYCRGAYEGRWSEKYSRNFPGPFYSTTMNMNSLAACAAAGDPGFGASRRPRLVLYSHETDGTEWIWRQPRDAAELRRLLVAMANDEVLSYACDGNRHWDLATLRAWWGERETVLSWARACLRTTVDDGAQYVHGSKSASDHAALRALLDYYAGPAAHDLARYAFFLSEGRVPGRREALPAL